MNGRTAELKKNIDGRIEADERMDGQTDGRTDGSIGWMDVHMD